MATFIDHRAELTMPIEVFLMVLGAALVHATWNALVKTDGDRLSLIKIMSGTQIGVSLILIPFVSVPATNCWLLLLASSVLNTGYMFMLNQAYQSGDLGLVYPFARGVAPLVVAIASVVALGEKLSGNGRSLRSDHRCRNTQGTSKSIEIGVSRDDPAWHELSQAWS